MLYFHKLTYADLGKQLKTPINRWSVPCSAKHGFWSVHLGAIEHLSGLSGYQAQKLGIRPVFLTCVGALALLSAAGYLMMRRWPSTAPASAAPAATQSSAASTE